MTCGVCGSERGDQGPSVWRPEPGLSVAETAAAASAHDAKVGQEAAAAAAARSAEAAARAAAAAGRATAAARAAEAAAGGDAEALAKAQGDAKAAKKRAGDADVAAAAAVSAAKVQRLRMVELNTEEQTRRDVVETAAAAAAQAAAAAAAATKARVEAARLRRGGMRGGGQCNLVERLVKLAGPECPAMKDAAAEYNSYMAVSVEKDEQKKFNIRFQTYCEKRRRRIQTPPGCANDWREWLKTFSEECHKNDEETAAAEAEEAYEREIAAPRARARENWKDAAATLGQQRKKGKI